MEDMSKRPFREQTFPVKVAIVAVSAFATVIGAGVLVLLAGIVWTTAISVWR